MRTLLALLVSSVALACGPADSRSTESGDRPREEVARQVVEPPPRRPLRDDEAERVYTLMRNALDSDEGWRETRYLEFDWVLWLGSAVLTRSYRFAPWHGDFRVETDLDGRRMVAIGNWNTPTPPRVWMDGEEIRGDSALTLRRRSERMFELDANQLLLPFRWDDLRVSVEYLGRETDENGSVVEVVALADMGSALSDEPRQIFHIDADTGIPVRSLSYPAGSESATRLDWQEWEEHGPLLLSTVRRSDGPSEIRFENIRVQPRLPQGRFAPPR